LENPRRLALLHPHRARRPVEHEKNDPPRSVSLCEIAEVPIETIEIVVLPQARPDGREHPEEEEAQKQRGRSGGKPQKRTSRAAPRGACPLGMKRAGE
jgi:hypothetical protein